MLNAKFFILGALFLVGVCLFVFFEKGKSGIFLGYFYL